MFLGMPLTPALEWTRLGFPNLLLASVPDWVRQFTLVLLTSDLNWMFRSRDMPLASALDWCRTREWERLRLPNVPLTSALVRAIRFQNAPLTTSLDRALHFLSAPLTTSLDRMFRSQEAPLVCTLDRVLRFREVPLTSSLDRVH